MANTGYEAIPTIHLETLIEQHVDLGDIDKNDAVVLSAQLLEWSRR